ncbi:hypothetical protein SCA6_007993 [Theobroma cacao]
MQLLLLHELTKAIALFSVIFHELTQFSIESPYNDKLVFFLKTLYSADNQLAEGTAKATKYNAAAFIPFSLGPRSCVGMSFATTETKTALSMILQRYTFTLSPAYVHSPFTILKLQPQHGIQVMLHSLQSGA